MFAPTAEEITNLQRARWFHRETPDQTSATGTERYRQASLRTSWYLNRTLTNELYRANNSYCIITVSSPSHHCPITARAGTQSSLL